jgi:hypothetical protein
MLVAGEPFGHLRDLLLLLFDEGAKMLDRLPRVLGGDAGAVAVVAAPAGGDEVGGLPEQVRRLRARHQVVDGCWRSRCSAGLRAGTRSRSGRERLCGAVAILPSSSGDRSFAKDCTELAPCVGYDELSVPLLGEPALNKPLIDARLPGEAPHARRAPRAGRARAAGRADSCGKSRDRARTRRLASSVRSDCSAARPGLASG